MPSSLQDLILGNAHFFQLPQSPHCNLEILQSYFTWATLKQAAYKDNDDTNPWDNSEHHWLPLKIVNQFIQN